MECKNCGNNMIGDGYTLVIHCEFAEEESYTDHEPDADPVYCDFDPYDERGHQG